MRKAPERGAMALEPSVNAARSCGLSTLALAVLLPLVACSSPPAPLPVTLRIALFGTVEDLPYFVMRERGIDGQYGLRFVESQFVGGTAIINAAATGTIDVGINIGAVPALIAASNGVIPAQVRIVAASTFADPDHPGAGVLASFGVNRWQDLEGKPVAVAATNSISGVALKGRLRQENVRPSSVVEVPFANMGLAVAGGNVAAAVMVEPWLTQSLLRGDGKLLGRVLGSPPFERVEQTLMVSSTTLRQQHPEALKAFLRAHLQAVRWMDQHPEPARDVLTKALGLSREVGQQMKMVGFSVDGRHDRPGLERMQLQLVEFGALSAVVPVSGLLDDALLSEVLAEKR
jgi:NitT/TauT family transport system substrate-binding protein